MQPFMFNLLKQCISLTRLNKPIGIYLLLWPTLWALWLAGEGSPDYQTVVIFILGVVLMRSAGCVINDIADRRFDLHVARTRNRPLTAGTISNKAALILFLILISVAFLLVVQLNTLTIFLSFSALLVAVIYPFFKRFTHFPQVILGIAFSFGVPMAFAAETNAIPVSAWILFLGASLWPLIYDTLYAMTDREDDIKIGIKSTAILFGLYDRFIIGILQILFLSVLVTVGVLFHLHMIYFLSLTVSLAFFIYQQILIRNRHPARCFQAFLNNHWVGFIIFIGVILNYL